MMPTISSLAAAGVSREWAFPLLTLDGVARFYELMGLPSTDARPNLQEVLREATVDLRRQVQQAIGGAASPTIEGYFRSVANVMKPATAERLAWWLQNVLHVDARDYMGLSRWDNMLRYCRHSPERWERLGLPERASSAVLERFVDAIDMSEYKRRFADLQSAPLSDWDLHMYASQLYDVVDDGPRLTVNPFLTVRLTIRRFKGYQFWSWMLRELNHEQLTDLWKSAQAIAKEEDRKSLLELPHPAMLDTGL
jgi:hypothetical protein